MKHVLKNLVCLTLAALMILGCCTSAMACTGFYVGKDASANGSIVIGHTVDAMTYAQGKVVVYPHDETPGRVIKLSDELSVPLPDVTYQFSATPFHDPKFEGSEQGAWDNAVINELGVASTGSVTIYCSNEMRNVDPKVKAGASETWINGYIGACATSARHAVELYGQIMETYGSSESNIFMFADQNEAWYLESLTGHQWIAVKMPDDCVAVFGNQPMLRSLKGYVDGETMLHSADFFKLAEDNGLAKYDDEGNFDVYASYSGSVSLSAGNNRRTWYGHVMFAPSTAGNYNVRTVYDLFYQPDEKITLDKVFAMTRSRYEGTEWNPEDTGRPDIRVIGVETQINCGVIEINPNLPAAMCGTTWNTVSNAEYSVYLPLNNLATDTAPMFKYTPEGFEGGAFGYRYTEAMAHETTTYGYNLDIAHTHFKRLNALAEQDRKHYGTGVRAYWESEEKATQAEYTALLDEIAALYAADPAAAAEKLTAYTVQKQEKALADADTIFDELMWYMINYTKTMTYSTSSGEFSNWPNFVPSLMPKAE